MCGIAGCLLFGQEVERSASLKSATQTLSHRGPDNFGYAVWDAKGDFLLNEDLSDDHAIKIGIGHRRLSVLDLSEAGRQPMSDFKGRWIVYNGEVFNYKELRTELNRFGYSFSTETDTEVILAAYDYWGSECTRRFNGMWAFCIYDPADNSLFCSRDRFGIKPFYYTVTNRGFFFASELAALFAQAKMRPRFDFRQLQKYLLTYMIDDGEETLYSGVRELLPAHSMRVEAGNGQIKTSQYWELPDSPDLELETETALDTFSELFEDAVRIRLRADVPIAVLLSGGIDSSAVAVAASRASGGQIECYTSHFPDNPEIDETRYADLVAVSIRINQHKIVPAISDILSDETLLTKHQALPYSSLSLYVHWALLNAIQSKGVPIVLSGQGGDELFLGYERYYVAHMLTKWAKPHEFIASATQGTLNSKLSPSQMLAATFYFGSKSLRWRWLLQRARKSYSAAFLRGAMPPERMVTSHRRALQRREICGQQLRHLLRYDDRTASAHGMETRLPFLDYRLVEFAYRLPWKHKIRDGWTKHLLRLYLARHVPAEVAWRRRKLGFNAPHVVWTSELVAHRGAELRAHRLADSLLRKGAGLANIPFPARWDVYNVLNLASLMGCEEEVS